GANVMTSRRLSGFIVVLICVVSAATAFAQSMPIRASQGRLVELKVSAPSLKGNLLGDPTEQDVAIYLPPSYDTSPTKRYPTLYLLHGFTATYKAWTNNAYQGMSLQSLMDEMIKSG